MVNLRLNNDYQIESIFTKEEAYNFDTLSDVYEALCDIKVNEARIEPRSQRGEIASDIVTRFSKE